MFQRGEGSWSENAMKIAGVQMDVSLGDIEANVQKMTAHLRESHRAGAQLTIFPECAATGYCFENLEEGRRYAQPVPGPVTEALAAACRERDLFSVVGMLEADGSRVFNAAVLIGPQGVIGSYRKVHLPYLGIDMYTTYGDRPFAVHEAGGVRVGMNICYDSAFPEAARCLALLGADLIALPTNWPPGGECVARHAIRTRAMENAVYYAAVNRVGSERAFNFIGLSSICAPNGDVLAESTGADEQVLYAEIDPEKARRKRIVRVPNKHEIDRLADRRPEMYAALLTQHALPTPRQDHER
jgi:predicted amidohydrolase